MTRLRKLAGFMARGSSGSAVPVGRDLRIDLMRGIALMMIFINHIPGNNASLFMIQNVAFSDAADLFVLLAGVSATLAYGPIFRASGVIFGSLKVLSRVWQIYIGHLALFFIISGLIAWAVNAFDNPLYIETVNILPLFENAAASIALALTLSFQPYYLDILPLYILLLAGFPLMLGLLRTSPLALLLVSFTLWACANWLGWNLPNKPGAGGWFFNPFAWQLIFVVGMVIGEAMRAGFSPPRSRLYALAAGIMVLGFAILKSPWSDFWGITSIPPLPEAWRLEANKTNLSLLRVLNILVVFYLVCAIMPRDWAWLHRRPARWIIAAGQHSLEAFCFGVVLSVAGYIAITESRVGVTADFIVSFIGCSLLLGLGSFLSWYKSMESGSRVKTGRTSLPGAET